MAPDEDPMHFNVPFVIRGEVIRRPDVAHHGRRGNVIFSTPAIGPELGKLLLPSPLTLLDLYQLRFGEIVEYLAELSALLKFGHNSYLAEAFELSRRTSRLSDGVLRQCYETIARYFQRDIVRDMASHAIGTEYLDGWVTSTNASGTQRVRALGCRIVHVIAGNIPTIAALSVVRAIVTRSDSLIKAPSNDPLTCSAIARTMIDMAPEHPITKHLSVVYWKGGDEPIEREIYSPRVIDKIVAWGGAASIGNVSRSRQLGIDVIAFEPKHSITIIGPEALSGASKIEDVSKRLAVDIGNFDQEACFNSRVIYVLSGANAAGIARVKELAEATLRALKCLPAHVSGGDRGVDYELLAEIDGLRLAGTDAYEIIGNRDGPVVIVSNIPAPVDFAFMLSGRVANFVPVSTCDEILKWIGCETQTVSVFPDALKSAMAERLAVHGAQRLVSLGGATIIGRLSGPEDGMEPLRRMCRWIVDETVDASVLDSFVDGRSDSGRTQSA